MLSRLTALKERIEGTEALIEIDLDHRRNELVAFDLVRPVYQLLTLAGMLSELGVAYTDAQKWLCFLEPVCRRTCTAAGNTAHHH